MRRGRSAALRPQTKPAFGGILDGRLYFRAKDQRFVRLFNDALLRPPNSTKKIRTLRSVVLSNHPTTVTVGMTRYSRVRYLIIFSKPSQRITFYADLLNALSDKAAEAVIAHELAHAWLNEHVAPVESARREREADRLARKWGFRPELEALDKEAETVN